MNIPTPLKAGALAVVFGLTFGLIVVTALAVVPLSTLLVLA